MEYNIKVEVMVSNDGAEINLALLEGGKPTKTVSMTCETALSLGAVLQQAGDSVKHTKHLLARECASI